MSLTRPFTRSLTRGLTRGLVPSPITPVDPIADIPALFDLRSHNGNKVPQGIATGDGAANPTWIGQVSQVSQPTSGKQPLTRYEADGTPYLEFDGTNDQMVSTFGPSEFNSAGSLAVAFKYNTLTDYGTPIGGGASGPGVVSASVIDGWGLGSPGAYGPQSDVSSLGEWFVGVYSWSGTSFRYTVKKFGMAPSSGSGTLPMAFAAITGNMGLGAHISDAPYSYFSGRIIAARASNQQWTVDQMDRILDYYINLLPT